MQDARTNKSSADVGLSHAPRARVAVAVAPATSPEQVQGSIGATPIATPRAMSAAHPGDDASASDDSPPRVLVPVAPSAPPKTTSHTRATPVVALSCNSSSSAAPVDATSGPKGPMEEPISLTQHHAEQWRSTEEHLRQPTPRLQGRDATGPVLTGAEARAEGELETETMEENGNERENGERKEKKTEAETPTAKETELTTSGLTTDAPPHQLRPVAPKPHHGGEESGGGVELAGVAPPTAKVATPPKPDEENAAVQQVVSLSRTSLVAPSLPPPRHRLAPLMGSTPSTSGLLPPIRGAPDIKTSSTAADKERAAGALALEKERLKEELAELRRLQ